MGLLDRQGYETHSNQTREQEQRHEDEREVSAWGEYRVTCTADGACCLQQPWSNLLAQRTAREWLGAGNHVSQTPLYPSLGVCKAAAPKLG